MIYSVCIIVCVRAKLQPNNISKSSLQKNANGKQKYIKLYLFLIARAHAVIISTVAHSQHTHTQHTQVDQDYHNNLFP